MIKFNRVLRMSVLASGLLTASCSDGDGDGASVPNSTELAALSDAQAQTLCRDWEKKYKDSLPSERAYCTANAGDDDLTTATCEANVQQCLDDDEYAAEKASDWGCDLSSAEEFTGEEPCAATVGEWRACVEAELKQLRSVVQRVSCDDLSSFEGAWEHPSECEKVFDKCPDADT